MRIAGTFAVDAPPPLVWHKVRDTALMAQCIPGCERIGQTGPDTCRAVVSVRVGPIGARFNLTVTILSGDPPRRIVSRTAGEEGTRASVVTSDNVVTLAETPGGGTDVGHEAEVSVTGRLGKFGLGIFRKKADQMAEQFVAAFRQRLAVAA